MASSKKRERPKMLSHAGRALLQQYVDGLDRAFREGATLPTPDEFIANFHKLHPLFIEEMREAYRVKRAEKKKEEYGE